MLMTSELFWDITQRRMIKDYHSTLRNTPKERRSHILVDLCYKEQYWTHVLTDPSYEEQYKATLLADVSYEKEY
jgi:hypothetical protein